MLIWLVITATATYRRGIKHWAVAFLNSIFTYLAQVIRFFALSRTVGRYAERFVKPQCR